MNYGWGERVLFAAFLAHRMRQHKDHLLSLATVENGKLRHFVAQCDGQVLRVNNPVRPKKWRAIKPETMRPNERLRQFKQRTRLRNLELAAMFGVHLSTVEQWYHDKLNMAIDCQRTLLRFEATGVDCLEKVRPQRVAR